MAAAFDPEVLLLPSGQRVFFGTTFPAATTDTGGVSMQQGDVIINKAATVQDGPYGWYCITTGLPGTWVMIAGAGSNAAFGISARRVAHAQYSFAVDGGGAPGLITPASNATIPAKAIITNVIINVTTAVTATGSATISIGTSAGSSAASLLAATAKASFTPAGFVQGVPVPQTASTWVKMTAAGSITLTSAVGAITAGIIEIYVEYTLSLT